MDAGVKEGIKEVFSDFIGVEVFITAKSVGKGTAAGLTAGTLYGEILAKNKRDKLTLDKGLKRANRKAAVNIKFRSQATGLAGGFLGTLISISVDSFIIGFSRGYMKEYNDTSDN